jgi:hypothetical protein
MRTSQEITLRQLSAEALMRSPLLLGGPPKATALLSGELPGPTGAKFALANISLYFGELAA